MRLKLTCFLVFYNVDFHIYPDLSIFLSICFIFSSSIHKQPIMFCKHVSGKWTVQATNKCVGGMLFNLGFITTEFKNGIFSQQEHILCWIKHRRPCLFFKFLSNIFKWSFWPGSFQSIKKTLQPSNVVL